MRGLDLQITYTRPLRRTTRQSLLRFFADFKELKTFMAATFRSGLIFKARDVYSD